ncbi:MAG: DUF302 domain-containing protein [Phycisphaerae bacterium]
MGIWQGVLAAGILAGGLTVGAFAQGSDTTYVPSGPGVAVTTQASVARTVSKLKHMIAHGGMMVLAQINMGKMMAKMGVQVQSEILLVGSPRVGKMLFSADPGVGVVVPIRINVYQDAAGDTVVRYVPPSRRLDKFHNPKVTMIAKMLDRKLHQLTAMVGH